MARESKTAIFLSELNASVKDVIANSRPEELVSGRGVVAYARTIWAYSAAAKLLGEKDCLYKAAWLKDYFLEHFIDHKYGGVYGSVDAAGEKLDTDKKADFISAAIFGLSEYAAAAKDDVVTREASALYLCMEQYMHCDKCGAYVELMSRDWSSAKGDGTIVLNTLLHVLEAYDNLYKVWPDERLAASIESLVRLFIEKVQDADGVSYVSYNMDWSVADAGFNYGHQLSLGWLLIYSAMVLSDMELLSEVREKAHASVHAGFHAGRQADGSMISKQLADGTVVTDKQFWMQPEAVIAAMFMWKYNACGKAAGKALQTWESIKAAFPGMNSDLYHSVRMAGLVKILMSV